jgi:hypothetical protein
MVHPTKLVVRTIFAGIVAGLLISPGRALALNLGSREACKAALAREDAGRAAGASRAPCHNAFLANQMAEDLRNEVASLMSPTARPNLDDLVIATLTAEAALSKDTRAPWGYVANFDIARRVGDADVMRGALTDLQRVAPNHPATKWAFSRAPRPSVWVWIVRVLLIVGLLGTAAHAAFRFAVRRRASRTTHGGSVALACIAFLCGGLCASTTGADELPKKDHLSVFTVDDANPEASVPTVEQQNASPLQFGYYMQDLAAKAEKAERSGDHARSARYYAALSKAAPTVAYPARKLCQELEAAGDSQQAIIACRTALVSRGTIASDYTRFVSMVLASKDPLPAGEREELETAISHLEHEVELGALPTLLRCEVDLRFEDYRALDACTQQLAKKAPNDPKTISLEWAVAMDKHDSGAVDRLIAHAREVGMKPEGIAKMEQATRTMGLRRVGRLVIVGLVGALLAAGLVVGFRRASAVRRTRLAA